MSTDGPRFTFDPAGHGRRVDASSRPRLLSIAFAALWLSGWLLLLTLSWLEFSRFGRVNFFGVALLVFGGGPVALALLWVAGGKRESLTVTGDATIRIKQRAGPFVLSRIFAADVVRAIGVAEVTEGALSDLVAVRRFYSGATAGWCWKPLEAVTASAMASPAPLPKSSSTRSASSCRRCSGRRATRSRPARGSQVTRPRS